MAVQSCCPCDLFIETFHVGCDSVLSTCKEVGDKVASVAFACIKGLARVLSRCDSMFQFLRLSGLMLGGFQLWRGCPFSFDRLYHDLEIGEGMTDFLSIFTDVNDLVSGEYKNDILLDRITRIVLFTANALGFCMVLDDCNLIDLGALAASIGEISFLGFVAEMTLGPVVQGVLATYHLCKFVECTITLTETTGEVWTHALLDLISRVFEVAVKTFILFGGIYVPAIIILGCLAASMSLIAFLFEQSMVSDTSSHHVITSDNFLH